MDTKVYEHNVVNEVMLASLFTQVESMIDEEEKVVEKQRQILHEFTKLCDRDDIWEDD